MESTALAPAVQLGAAALLLLVVARAGVLLFESTARARGLRRAFALEHEQLAARVAAARARQTAAEEQAGAWAGWRKFQVLRKVEEAEGVCSLYLGPHDGRPLPGFLPGQHLTLQLSIPGHARRIVRCYSLSEAPRPEHYRLTIKRVAADTSRPGNVPGLASNFVHDHVGQGDILDVKAPGGHFVLDPLDPGPVVLVAGGVGITPLACMLQALAARGGQREAWLFYGVRNAHEHALREELDGLVRGRAALRRQVAYSEPADKDVAGRDYDHAGRVTIDLLRRVLPSSHYDFYLCGPGPMMNDLIEGLRAWGVPDERVHFELFGPASVKQVARAAPSAAAGTSTAVEVLFERSGKRGAWTPESGSLLDLAESLGVALESGCRAGSCGTCVTAVKQGEATHRSAPGFPVERGSCLACVAVPAHGPLVLDA